jgi:phospholipid/cholesterol/gamma-HCH transport system substrate-binding protein
MKINNETKVGIISVVSVAFLIIGFNFLKGKKLWSNDIVIKGKYGNVQGLQTSNAIMINGMQVGSVYKINMDKDMREIVVDMNITKDVNIPINSVAFIKTNPLGAPSIEIRLGDSKTFLKNKENINTELNEGMLGELLRKADPILFEVKKALGSIDTLADNFNSVVDENAKGNINAMLNNLNRVTAALVSSTASLGTLLNAQNGSLAKTLDNASSISGNLASNNSKINSVVSNLDKTSSKFANINIQNTLDTLDKAITQMKNLITSFNATDGTLGKLLHDPTLYKNLASSGNKLNLLLDDVRLNPKRYINISLFGKKNKNQALMVPLPDTLNSPYYVETVK